MRAEDNTLGLVVLGGGLVTTGVLAWRAMQSTAAIAPSTTLEIGSWTHPVPTLGDRPAVVSNPFRPRGIEPATRTHLGVDIMFRRRDTRDLIAVFPPATTSGTKLFFMPSGIPALAASAGLVAFSSMTPTGNTVVVGHVNGWATYYTHLASLAVRVGDRVRTGQSLGTIGASPKDAEGVRHLHFELWPDAVRERAVDPAPFLAAWSRTVLDWNPMTSASTPRNADLSAYRPVGDRNERYPDWVRDLRGKSGVYVIREQRGPIAYVGSSVGRLYETVTRHFQRWRRYKGFWRGQFAEGHDPGLTYDRGDVEVAIKLTAPDDAHDEERRMIRRLQPRDNVLGQPELEDAPF
ncbi:MAG: peptidoglycan DD-metalloendopeptidase family protein [Kofleriaceae bacterium]